MGHFTCKDLDQSRAISTNSERISEVLDVADRKAENSKPQAEDCEIIRLRVGNIEELAELYATVVETYPFPLQDPSFLKKSMTEDTAFFGIVSDDKLVAGLPWKWIETGTAPR